MKIRKKTLDIQDKIFEYCKNEERKITEISEFLNMNYNTVRSYYVYKMIRTGRLKKINGIRYQSVTGFRKVTAEQWKEMGLPEEISYISSTPFKKT